MEEITEEERAEILDLFYNKIYTIGKIKDYYEDKFKESQIRQVIKEQYKWR